LTGEVGVELGLEVEVELEGGRMRRLDDVPNVLPFKLKQNTVPFHWHNNFDLNRTEFLEKIEPL